MDDRLDGIKSGITKDQRASHLKDVSLRSRRSLSTTTHVFPPPLPLSPLPPPSSLANTLSRLHHLWNVHPRRRRECIYMCVYTYNVKRGKKRITKNNEFDLEDAYLVSFIDSEKRYNILGKFYRESRYANDHGISMKLLIKLLTFSRWFNVAEAICLRGLYRLSPC